MNQERIFEIFNRHGVNYLLIGGMNMLLRHGGSLTYVGLPFTRSPDSWSSTWPRGVMGSENNSVAWPGAVWYNSISIVGFGSVSAARRYTQAGPGTLTGG